jgi:hypothetical protein
MPRLDRGEILEQLSKLREMTKLEIEREFEHERALRDRANEYEKKKEEIGRMELAELGLQMEAPEHRDNEENEVAFQEIERVRREMIEMPPRAEDFEVLGLDESVLADSNAIELPLVGRELYASSPEFLTEVDGEVGPISAVPWNPHTSNPWCWARGGGWWSSYSYTIYSTFWFYFYPSASRYYAVLPQVRYRGFYVLRADDKWWNSKYAQVVTDVRVRAHQYNWKSESVYPVLNHGDDNININWRFDNDRTFYYSFLTGANDLAWIRVMVRIYAYARGSGSYAEINFASGSANYLQAPTCATY